MFGRRDSAIADAARKDSVPPRPSAAVTSLAALERTPTRGHAGGRHAVIAADSAVASALDATRALIDVWLTTGEAEGSPRGELARRLGELLDEALVGMGRALDTKARRDAITVLLNELLERVGGEAGPGPAAALVPTDTVAASRDSVEAAKRKVQPILMRRIDLAKAATLARADLAGQIADVVAEILGEERMQLNALEQRDLITTLLNDMLGLGPLEPLLADEAVIDILVNGADGVFVERGGKLIRTDVTFADDAHVMNVAQRIVSGIGRRIDETTPLVDARLEDGSRVNIIIPPLAVDGPCISIRKFAKQEITLESMERQGNLSAAIASVLRIAARAGVNILISGGTGSGKTTLLNAMSRMIEDGERIVTIEDAAELRLQQPHVVRLETRPPNLEGGGEISQRDLVKNALRMRPDRIILGEIRAGEAFDMLQAMNTGHDGSMCTIHANRPREALARLENMVAMAGVNLPNKAVRAQIAGAVNLIVQIARMRDGVRRISYVTEVVGMEGDVITTQDLFTFAFEGEDAEGRISGRYVSAGLKPKFITRARYYGLDTALMAAVG